MAKIRIDSYRVIDTALEDSSTLKSYLYAAIDCHDKNLCIKLINNMSDFKELWANPYDSFHKMAIENSWDDILALMIKRGAKFKKSSSIDVNPLHFAAEQKYPKCAEVLCQQIDPNCYFDEEETPLMVAAKFGNVETMEALLKNGADATAEVQPRVTINFLIPSIIKAGLAAADMIYVDSVIHKATQSKDYKTIEMLLKYKPDLDLNKRGAKGKTPLIIATEDGNIKMVEYLLNLGVKTDLKVNNGTALHKAVEIQSEPIVRLLLEHGVNQKITDNRGMSALQKAIYEEGRYNIDNKNLIELMSQAWTHPESIVKKSPFYYSKLMQEQHLKE